MSLLLSFELWMASKNKKVTAEVTHVAKQYCRFLMQLSSNLLCLFSVEAKRQCEKCHYF